MQLLLVLAACVSLVAAAAPLLNVGLSTTVDDQYMVVFQLNSTSLIRDLHVTELARRFKSHERVINVFTIGKLIGYSAVLSKDTLAKELEHPNVRYIEADQVVTINEDAETQTAPTWGLDRIDQRALPLSKTYSYYASSGAGVTAYVIDTGIRITHSEFAGRARYGVNTVPGETDEDGNGHGTHVAGTIGGKIYGVAKNVDLVAVKVLSASGSGTWTGVVSGVEWVTNDHKARKQTNPNGKTLSVANMSLGGGVTPTLDTAVEESIAEGVHYAIAAGNYADDACYYSPARVPSGICVGATTNTDARASFSNVGKCVDIFAPGNAITSAWYLSDTATNTISGTSMAAPHVAGAVAVYLGHAVAENLNVPLDPISVELQFKDHGTRGVVKDAGTNSPNILLYSPFSDIEP